jgi:small subunit ribosomal protein S17e
VQNYEWFSLSKVKKIAEDFLAKHPTLFSADFEANKKALDRLAVIPNRALRNQIAGAITKKMASEGPEKSESDAAMDESADEQSPQTTEAPTETVAQETQ